MKAPDRISAVAAILTSVDTPEHKRAALLALDAQYPGVFSKVIEKGVPREFAAHVQRVLTAIDALATIEANKKSQPVRGEPIRIVRVKSEAEKAEIEKRVGGRTDLTTDQIRKIVEDVRAGK